MNGPGNVSNTPFNVTLQDSFDQADQTKDGGIVGVKFGGQNVVFLNDRATVKELAEKRSAIYSCRPDIYFRVFSDNNNMVLRE